MQLPQTRLRWLLAGPYCVVASLIVLTLSYNDSFCERPGSQSYPIMVVKLSLALTAWDFVAGFAGARAFTVAEKALGMPGISVLLTSLMVGAGFAYTPFFIY